MGKLGIFLQDQQNGPLIGDHTNRAQQGILTTNERGFESFKYFYPVPFVESFRLFDRPISDHLVVTDGVTTAFEGRTEDRAIVEGGIEITALGYQRALSDVPYTSLWSDTHLARWRIVNENERANTAAEKWEYDNNNRIYITPRVNETIGAAVDNCEFTYAAPHLGENGIASFDCSYTFDFPTNWQFIVITCAYDYSGAAVVNTITSAGSPLSGTLALTFTEKRRIIVQVKNNTGSAQKIGVDTGVYYLRLTGLRVKSNTAATVTANLIVSDLISFITKINPLQLSDQDSIFSNPTTTVDLKDLIIEDQYPSDILNETIEQGLTAVRMAWAVWEKQILQFYQRSETSGSIWHTDITGLALSRTADTLANSVYGVFQNGYNENERTNTAGESKELIALSGVVRRAFVAEGGQGQAEQRRDLMLAERQTITPKARIELSGLYTPTGARVPLWLCRAGDIIKIRNLPPNYSPTIDKIRNFYVSATSYDLDNDILSPAPELDIPGLDVILGNISPRNAKVKLSKY